MNNSFLKIVWLKAAVSFLIPFLTAIGIAVEPYVGADSAQPTLAGWIVLICAPLVAGFSALSSFLSTTFAEHKAKQEAGLDDSDPAPITQAQAAVPIVVPAATPPATPPPAAAPNAVPAAIPISSIISST
jgi:hypothetical protein